MTGDNRITCAECDEFLAGYFEEDLDVLDKAKVDSHVAGCLRCQGLIRDIGDVRATAAALPELSPSRDLWGGIAARIEAPALSVMAARRERGLSRRWLAVAAAALIVVSSGITYVAASRSTDNAGVRVEGAARSTAGTRLPGSIVKAPSNDGRPGVQSSTAESMVASENLNPIASRGSKDPAPRQGTALVTRRAVVAATASELELTGEIGRLQAMLRQRKGELDPATVKVVEDNLALIDRAVSQARAAMAGDPASGFLSKRMDEALQKKLELLRTVAMLPATT